MISDILEKRIIKKPDSSGAGKVPELLSPAGSPECGYAAILGGADAVYAGLKEGSARAGADNFTFDELRDLCEFAHLRGAKVYVAVNTTPFGDDEAERFSQNVKKAACAGADGVILQDPGLIASAVEMRLKGLLLPDFRIHISTQAGIGTAEGIEFIKAYGADRVILPRELTLGEIEDICRRTDTEIEIFVHGAMCMCYSGSCLLSSYIGGRSGNRGSCAQPCRLPYSLCSGSDSSSGSGSCGTFSPLLSPDDLCALRLIDRIAKAGVTSVKIEGRLKSPGYAALTARIYREALDAASEGRFDAFLKYDLEDALRAMQALFTRSGGGTGYLCGNRGKNHMTGQGAGRRGVYIGAASGLKKVKRPVADGSRLGFFTFKLSSDNISPLVPGDGITVLDNRGNMVAGGTVNSFSPSSGEVLVCSGSGQNGPFPTPLPEDLSAYLTSDSRLEKALEKMLSDTMGQVRMPLDIKFTAAPGEKAILTVTSARGEKHTVSVLSPIPVSCATAAPLRIGDVKERLGKLGNTCFYANKTDVSFPDNIFLPVAVLNSMRREAVEKISELLTTVPAQKLPAEPASEHRATMKPELEKFLSDSVGKPRSYLYYGPELPEDFTFEPAIYYLPHTLWHSAEVAENIHRRVSEAGGLLMVSLPWLPLGNEYREFMGSACEIAPHCHGFRFTTPGDFGLIKGKFALKELQNAISGRGLIICADLSPGIASAGAAKALGQFGADIVTLSPEYPDLSIAAKLPDNIALEVIDDGPVPLMRMRHCIIGHGAPGCSRCGKGGAGQFFITGTDGEKYDILTLPDNTGGLSSDSEVSDIDAPGPAPGNSRMCRNLILSRRRFEPKAGMRAGNTNTFKEFYSRNYPDGVIVRRNIK